MNCSFKIHHFTLGNSARYGGSVIAVDRLHQSLIRAGVDSKVFCGYLDQVEPGLEFEVLPRPKLLRYCEAIIKRIAREIGLNDVHNLSTFLLKKNLSIKETDVLNFHAIHHGYFNFLALPHLTADKPAVYTMHDMWAFTGHCAYSFQCDRWKTGCGNCPDLITVPAVKRDATQLEWQFKKWTYQRANLSIVCPSLWLANLAKESILGHYPVYHIPYGIDTDVYQPLDPQKSRSILGIPQDKHVLMFGAANLKDSRKGLDLLISALTALPESFKAKLVLMVFGGFMDLNLGATVGIETVNLGYINQDVEKALAFSAADLFVFPTRADNLPLVLQESLASGTPIASFNVGGVPELVRPGVTGYLAEPENAQDLRNGIVELLENQDYLHRLGTNCRHVALTEYSMGAQARRYIEVYEKVLS